MGYCIVVILKCPESNQYLFLLTAGMLRFMFVVLYFTCVMELGMVLFSECPLYGGDCLNNVKSHSNLE